MVVPHQPSTMINRWWCEVQARVVLGLANVVASCSSFGGGASTACDCDCDCDYHIRLSIILAAVRIFTRAPPFPRPSSLQQTRATPADADLGSDCHCCCNTIDPLLTLCLRSLSSSICSASSCPWVSHICSASSCPWVYRVYARLPVEVRHHRSSSRPQR